MQIKCSVEVSKKSNILLRLLNSQMIIIEKKRLKFSEWKFLSRKSLAISVMKGIKLFKSCF